ncbi:MAG TPA: T9SS type A sorting domain-containing protein [Bacteroidia bacterium]|nr:T9SS type A sorting domain-containing protein [Bacteroidia bacterium]
MNKRLLLPVAVCMVLISAGYAQSYKPYLNIPVTQFGNPVTPMANAWTGGFNTPSFSQIDMNGDGKKDLFVFEKEGASQYYFRYTTYINHGTANQVDYQYAPEYKEKFPKGMHDWAILVDYDCDGYEDIFTYNYTGGMTVYHNDYLSLGYLKFHKEIDLVYTLYFGFPANLFVASNSQPALVDVDNDGDLDVLTFAISSFLVEYHQNLAEENFGRCDTMVFNMATGCWGHFGLTGDTACTAVFGVSCRQAPYHPTNDVAHLEHLHSGFCAIAPDMDGDGDKEFINGDINCMSLQYFENGGTLLSANMTSLDSLYPSQHPLGTLPASLGRSQLGPHYFDVDNDGNKDLIVAPCGVNSKNFNNVLFYKNTTNNTINDFTYIKNSLFVDNMIELGSGANVALIDIDGDGLQDMIIGNYYNDTEIPSGTHVAIAHYRNTGTASSPAFSLVTTDFANASTTGFMALSPTFGDMDNDGDKDMITGSDDGFLEYYQNISGNYILTQVQILASNGNAIDVGGNAAPFIVDLNRDGKLDLVIGEKSGNLNYYENTGTINNYAFTFVTSALGAVNVTLIGQDIYGYSAPFIYDSLGHYQLMVGSLSGFVRKYDNIDGNLSGNFNLIDSTFFYEPIRSTIAGTDINNDGKIDFLVGNGSGGAAWYSNGSTVSIDEIQTQNSFNVYPNPAENVLYLKFEKIAKREIIITDMLSKTVFSSYKNSFGETIDLREWSNGMYVCKVVEDGIVSNKKFIIRH